MCLRNLRIALKGYDTDFDSPVSGTRRFTLDAASNLTSQLREVAREICELGTGVGLSGSGPASAIDSIKESDEHVEICVKDWEAFWNRALGDGVTEYLKRLLGLPNVTCRAWVSVGGYERLNQLDSELLKNFEKDFGPLGYENIESDTGGFVEIELALQPVREKYSRAQWGKNKECQRDIAKALRPIVEDLPEAWRESLLRTTSYGPRRWRWFSNDVPKPLIRLGLVDDDGKLTSRALAIALCELDPRCQLLQTRTFSGLTDALLCGFKSLQVWVVLGVMFSLSFIVMWRITGRPWTMLRYIFPPLYVLLLLCLWSADEQGGWYTVAVAMWVGWSVLWMYLMTANLQTDIRAEPPAKLAVVVEYPGWLFNRDKDEMLLTLTEKGSCQGDDVQVNLQGNGMVVDPLSSTLRLGQTRPIEVKTGGSLGWQRTEITLEAKCDKKLYPLEPGVAIQGLPLPFGVRQGMVEKLGVGGVLYVIVEVWKNFGPWSAELRARVDERLFLMLWIGVFIVALVL
jgi:hypothetical protein